MPGVHGGNADVARFTAAHDVVHRRPGLFDRCIHVEVVQHVDIDVVGAEALQAAVDAFHNVLARMALVVKACADRVTHFGGENQVVAAGNAF
ncbi:Uncharacterised protein [Cedecea neteri]|uniref:Uncharacterized protein n=1 Tax=Cedecea neteri TaxID=158822 RepID=A0A2X2TBE2_9ENTR|nr:Uncharacterised protein [Cedecea neteri]